MDHKTWIYLFILVGSYLFKFIVDRQKKLKQTSPQQNQIPPESIPQPINIFGEIKKLKTDFEKIQGNKSIPVQSYHPQPREVLSYENPETIQQVQIEKPITSRVRIQDLEFKPNLSGIKDVSSKTNEPSYRDYFKNPEDLKTAFILSEIINRKY